MRRGGLRLGVIPSVSERRMHGVLSVECYRFTFVGFPEADKRIATRIAAAMGRHVDGCLSMGLTVNEIVGDFETATAPVFSGATLSISVVDGVRVVDMAFNGPWVGTPPRRFLSVPGH